MQEAITEEKTSEEPQVKTHEEYIKDLEAAGCTVICTEENQGWQITHIKYPDILLNAQKEIDRIDYQDFIEMIKAEEEKAAKEEVLLKEAKEKAEKLINKTIQLNQGFKMGEYCKETQFKTERRGFMNVKFTGPGNGGKPGKVCEVYGYGEISADLLFINCMYAIGTSANYKILPAANCFFDMISYQDFLAIVTDFEKDIAYRDTEEYKLEQERIFNETKASDEQARQDKLQADLEKKRVELLGKRADEQEAEIKYMQEHPTASWLKHFWNKWFNRSI